ncbi:uncharacterized protein LOC105423327 [Pogonomyrmex barbatus]|uniref:Uncharacterized protein LOC105423327 n=1 Tax=Pogonomyrmex barbatus TaxID=144034 RepID=A0A6I9WI15_9HYME|nr:uncharacterized protein LOC105423327 [Pogonomyrmex barbatus]
MIIATFIPFFLAVQLPIEDGAWPYGPEYVFTVHMNVTGTPECSDNIQSCKTQSGYRITSRLYCIPKKNDTLNCSFKHVDGFNFGTIGEEGDVANRRKNITGTVMELIYNEEGIEAIIASQLTRVYDLNILKMVAEQLNPGDNFDNIGNGTFHGIAESTIGRCNVTFDLYRRPRTEYAETEIRRDFRLKLLPSTLQHTASTDMYFIDKTTNINDCNCYADGYFRKYGDTVVCEHLQADLEFMSSQMKISENSFSSYTMRKGTSVSNNETYTIHEITSIILEDIQPATTDSPIIMRPGKTKLFANHDVKSVSTN